MPLDWDKLRIFHAAARAGSFTHAAESLNLSQSAISRQVSALEEEIGAPLFLRHARGLRLTEQGELLYQTAEEVLARLQMVRSQLSDSKDVPSGTLRVTTTAGLGSGWLTDRLPEFIELYPQINLQLILSNDELDLTTREADCAIRLSQPSQPDLIQRKLFTVHFHLYASPAYLERAGVPGSLDDLRHHRIVTFGETVPAYLRDVNWLQTTFESTPGEDRPAMLQINDLQSIKRAVQRGAGIAMLPDYIVQQQPNLIAVPIKTEMPTFETYFVYLESLKSAAKLRVFRDFLLAKARQWDF